MKYILPFLGFLIIVFARCIDSPTDSGNGTVTHTVLFNSNGGSTVSSQQVTSGDSITEPPAPSRTGFEFEGWYSDEELTDLWSFSTSVTADMELYAGWAEVVTGAGVWVVAEDSLTDPDGNKYTTVQIGSQVWTVENLRTTSYADGTPIYHVTDSSEWGTLSTPAYCWYDNEPGQGYGAIYNWWVVDPDNPQNIAPQGWRVPRDEDWTELEEYLITNGYNWDGSTSVNKIGKALASNGGEWPTSSTQGEVGNDQGNNNSSGFSGLPGGYRFYSGFFNNIDRYGFWWSASEDDSSSAYGRCLGYDWQNMVRSNTNKRAGISVRLVRDI